MITIARKPDHEFLAQTNNIYSECETHSSDWNIDADRLTTFSVLLTTANTTYAANNNPATKNRTTSAGKKVAFGALKRFIGPFIDYLEANLAVPDTAILAMGLRPRERHAHLPLPRPTDPIVLSVEPAHGATTVYASRPEHDQPTSGVGPVRHHGFMLRYKIEGEENYQFTVSTRLHHTLYFESGDVGKRLLIAGAWVNPRLEPGPWSDELTELIN